MKTGQIISNLRTGGILVMPTDTVYGLVCVARNAQAVARMYEIKQRDGKPGTIIAASVEQLVDFGFLPKELEKAKKFWPDAVSVVLTAGPELDYLHMGRDSLAVRIPNLDWLREVLEQTGPLATTSANFPDQPTVTSIDQAKKLFGDKVDLYIDGGDLSNAKPSTIVRFKSDGSLERLR